jgi:disulfide bond formation protein DsbB
MCIVLEQLVDNNMYRSQFTEAILSPLLYIVLIASVHSSILSLYVYSVHVLHSSVTFPAVMNNVATPDIFPGWWPMANQWPVLCLAFVCVRPVCLLSWDACWRLSVACLLKEGLNSQSNENASSGRLHSVPVCCLLVYFVSVTWECA